MIIGSCVMYAVSTDYGVLYNVQRNYREGLLDCQVLRAPQYIYPVLFEPMPNELAVHCL